MPNRLIPYVKAVVHLLCLVPLALLLYRFKQDNLGADPVNTITHFTGDWTIYLLLISLAVTPVRRLHAKLSNLIRFRRMLGLYAFFYATLHLATYVFLFSGYDVPTAIAGVKAGHLGEIVTQFKLVWPTMWDDILQRRFIQVGFAAWVILLALAVTSPQFVLRAMGGKNWQRLHRLVYVAAFLGVVHFWWLVKAGVRTPWKDTAVLMLLLLARLAYTAWKRRRSSKTAARMPVSASRT
ncbi:sulfite oxidase heme-binding subunit YedZ [Granulicella arctica]|uniref:Protein-methionine-sulfoxide reductase heme-binding subunit MsrQ n=1 Tax=Granulicella arctica TaxID=940613 RepID=A0A7Y9PIJ6_9BACT|nr:protein-methionine-sulfoxide reductase heme-binding subunit MsrQ [Granulicella arctica]NYF80554.1 sulfoxide reductase heme-binding subunit YedZ [Granulicella arctica]